MAWTNSTLVEHRLSEDEKKVLASRGYAPEVVADVIKSLSVGEFVSAQKVSANNGRTRLLDYLEQLRQRGLDIGGRNSEYGYRIQTPPLEAFPTRKLKVFRRR